jgi:hypothetical protein
MTNVSLLFSLPLESPPSGSLPPFVDTPEGTCDGDPVNAEGFEEKIAGWYVITVGVKVGISLGMNEGELEKEGSIVGKVVGV